MIFIKYFDGTKKKKLSEKKCEYKRQTKIHGMHKAIYCAWSFSVVRNPLWWYSSANIHQLFFFVKTIIILFCACFTRCGGLFAILLLPCFIIRSTNFVAFFVVVVVGVLLYVQRAFVMCVYCVCNVHTLFFRSFG